MIELGGLATHPASQGLGYASALMPVVTDLVCRLCCILLLWKTT